MKKTPRVTNKLCCAWNIGQFECMCMSACGKSRHSLDDDGNDFVWQSSVVTQSQIRSMKNQWLILFFQKSSSKSNAFHQLLWTVVLLKILLDLKSISANHTPIAMPAAIEKPENAGKSQIAVGEEHLQKYLFAKDLEEEWTHVQCGEPDHLQISSEKSLQVPEDNQTNVLHLAEERQWKNDS